MQHFPRSAQTATVSVNGGDQAAVDVGKLALQNGLVLLILGLRARHLVTLHDFDLVAAVLALGERAFGVGATGSGVRGLVG